MIEPEKRRAIYLLHQEGMSLREIARRLRVSRNTARSVIKEKGAHLVFPHLAKIIGTYDDQNREL